MKYTYETDEYIKLLKEYYELEKMSFNSNDSKEYVLGKLEERSRKKKVIFEKANTIINEYIETFEKNPELCESDGAIKLEQLYMSLIEPKTQRELDIAITLRISCILKDYYKRTNKLHEYINALFNCVTNEKLLLFNHSDFYIESKFLIDTKEVLNRLDELSDEDKKVLYNTLYWVNLNHNSEDVNTIQPVESLIEIDNYLMKKVGKNDPILNGVIDSLGIARNSLNSILEHILWSKRHGLKVDKERYRPLMERFSNILRNKITNNPNLSKNLILSSKSVIFHADYQLGKITMEKLLEEITKLQGESDKDEGPLIQATRLAKFNYHYLTFLYRFSDYDSDKVIKMSQERIKEVLPKILNITKTYGNNSFNQYLLFFILGAAYTSRFDDFSNLILDMTVYSDKALFVHTEMVKELSIVMFDEIIEKNPEVLDGVSGKDTKYIINHKDEMRNLLKECCMFHDVGKFFMLDIVGNSMRRLTDEEFLVIKSHPGNFEEFSRNWMNQDERLICIHDCALTHHLWHDGSNGYPKIKHTKNRPFVDILSIADSIDAATDTYGRPYRDSKKLDELIQEFKNGANTRYSEVVVNSLYNPKVKEKIQELIENGRKDIYYKVYAFNKV